MTKLQIKRQVAKLQAESTGRVTYPKDLKLAIVDSIKDFKTQKEMGEYYNIRADRLNKWINGLGGKIKARTVKHGTTGIRYAISTKIEACEQVLEYGKTINAVCTAMGIAHNTLSIWLDDYREGKYTLDNVVQISRKKFRTYDLIIADIEKKTNELNSLKDEAKESLKREFDEKMTALEGK